MIAIEKSASEDVHVAKKEYVLQHQWKLTQRVTIVPRFKTDLRDMIKSLEGGEPPCILVQVKPSNIVLYSFVDASG